MKTVLLIDGDQYIYKATAAVEKETRWDDQNHVLYSNVNEAWDNVVRMIEQLFDRFDTRSHALTFSTYPGFRSLLVDPSYKTGRTARKPLCYAELRERVVDHYNCVAMPGLEADDVMGILATKPGKDKRIIISQDKDMKTIPCTLWREGELITVSEEEANYWHLYQTLVGDTSDGYKGCPGVGPVKAEKLLKAKHDDHPWCMVLGAFTQASLTEDDALKQARLARILRWSDWDSVKKEPILWTP